MGRLVIDRVEQAFARLVIAPHLERDHSLAAGREKIVRRKNLARDLQAQALEAGAGQDDPAQFAFSRNLRRRVGTLPRRSATCRSGRFQRS